MKTWVRKTLSVGVLAAGALLFGPTAAHAADLGGVDNSGVGSGTQIVAPVDLSLDVCGTGIGLAGDGFATGSCGAGGVVSAVPPIVPLADGTGASMGTGGNDGVLTGTQVYAPVQVPINLCGTALGLLGDAGAVAECESGETADDAGAAAGGAAMSTGGNDGVLTGTQVYAPVQAPINVCGTGLGVLDDAGAMGTCGDDDADGGTADAEMTPVAGAAQRLLAGLPLG
ncbi:Small secreted domain [Micromonospora pattaloongensis]|uniref:Small secreted domain n=1 Tax=Micromonospora pattaloongensis TaxID=405436 RepID=A0A1H3HYQ1_9ACTN|nr:chaplin family protein [Micromonospora pattaloongensis]SDY20355.1 Small secreted domain [Micromonospora pattaloongensis]